ncbi:hypothetical protein [Limnoglobus roseus]|uniref:Uncharacterized protein n=1 Tax=Limnoglobus roseus TaxID=2598579 RepID=A0A5C1AF55_9BACT|nr:hypothetical protein [Limnoglobus roseus]QEL15870.1 hypothetical protein PX52LOC_02806 [Limnoglobus roseus]QEL17430.1 hypothetical protein PX52LOC_04419 [Limnoglobus roseus]
MSDTPLDIESDQKNANELTARIALLLNHIEGLMKTNKHYLDSINTLIEKVDRLETEVKRLAGN